MGIDVFVTSLAEFWAEVPCSTLREVVARAPRVRRADPGVVQRSSLREWDELPWSDGFAWMGWQRRKLVNAYIAATTSRLGVPAWRDNGPGPDPYGSRIDPACGMFLRSVAIAASRNTLDAAQVIAETHDPKLGRREFFDKMEPFVEAYRGVVPAVAMERFPNVIQLDIANLYLPAAFAGCWVGGPLDIGSAPRFAHELRDLATVLGVDTTVTEWWKTRELNEDGPRRRSLYNLQLLGEACALSAAATLPILVAG